MVLLVHLVHQEPEVQAAHQVLQVQAELKDHRVLQVLQVLQELEVQVVQVVIPVHQEQAV